MTKYRVWAKEYYTAPYLADAEDRNGAIQAVLDGLATGEGGGIFENFLAGNSDEWEVDEIEVEEKIDESLDFRPISELAREAISIQDACNPCGLAQGFARAMIDLHRNLDSTQLQHHPIYLAWVSKFDSLSGGTANDVWRTDHLRDLANPNTEQKLEESCSQSTSRKP